MQAIRYFSLNMGGHYVRVTLALTVALVKIITNTMPTHVKTTIKYSLHQLFLKSSMNSTNKYTILGQCQENLNFFV